MKPARRTNPRPLTPRASNSKAPVGVQIKRRIAEDVYKMVKGFRGAMAAAYWKDMTS